MIRLRNAGLAGIAFCLAAGTALADAPAWTVEDDSRVGFRTEQSGATVEGVFERFEAEIRFDADSLDMSKVAVTIDVASVNSESTDRDTAIRSAPLFDVETYPTARFEATRFVANGDSQFEAHGTLTLRDVTKDVVLPFTLEIAPHPDGNGALQARAVGELSVLRLDYGVGQGVWTDTSVVPNEVGIFIDIVASMPGG